MRAPGGPLIVALAADDPRLEAFLRRDAALHAYELGDLDPFFRPHTRWTGLLDGAALVAVALLYRGSDPPTLLCFGDTAAVPLLRGEPWPDRLYAHLSPGLADALADTHVIGPMRRHRKMALVDRDRLGGDDDGIALLGPAHAPELERFYAEAYPGNWFAPRMLSAEPYVGLREDGALVAVAGLHVCSPRYGVAVLGNVAVRPSHRGRGLARRVSAAMCRRVLPWAETVALNVAAANAPAIAVYRRLGFAPVAEYDEGPLARA